MPPAHLEFSFCFHTCNLTNRVREVPNPFTRKTIVVPVDDGMTAIECEKLLNVLELASFKKSEIPGEGYELIISRHENLRIRGDILPGERDFGFEMVVRSLTDEMLILILTIARTGNFVLTSNIGDKVHYLDRTTKSKVMDRWPDAEFTESLSDLRHWIEDAIGGREMQIPGA